MTPLQLTDFASARVPKIETCSLQDMLSLKPGDIVTKLRFLFIVVITLVGVMNVGALIGLHEDLKERRELLVHITRPESGFTERQGGVWTWTFQQNALKRAVERPSGSAIEIATILGFPFIRLRAALPEELFAGSVAQSLGRKDGMSPAGLLAAREENFEVMQLLKRGMSCFSCRGQDAKIPPLLDEPVKTSDVTMKPPMRGEALAGYVPTCTLDYDDAVANESVIEWLTHEPDPTDMVGTALIFAFMANQKVLPVVELSEKMEAATAHFGEMRVPGIDHSFSDLLAKFMVMLGTEAGTLTQRGRWMQTARLWRFVLLQREDGCWDLTDSLAFALEAHEGRPPPKVKKERKGFQALVTLFVGEGELDENLDDAADDYMTSDGTRARRARHAGAATLC